MTATGRLAAVPGNGTAPSLEAETGGDTHAPHSAVGGLVSGQVA